MHHCPVCRRPLPASTASCTDCPGARTPETIVALPGAPPAADPPTRGPDPETVASGPATAAALPAGAAFGRYRLERSLGEGGMGVVWRAWDEGLRRFVALKQIKVSRAADGNESVERFLREARLAAKLRHPNIVGVYDVGCEDGQHYITMEYVEGRTLAAWLAETAEGKRNGRKHGMDRLRGEVRLLAEVAGAVAYAHEEGVVHRDLKPSNVLLDGTERPYVMDFGLAKEVSTKPESGATPPSHPLTLSGQVLGTPAYMSPEQVDGDAAAIGPRCDVWALGVMLYETLTGRLPFGGDGNFRTLYAVLQDEPARPRKANPFAPDELEAVCLKALDKDPARRYATAREFGEELQRWLRGEPVQARRQTVAYRLWRRLVRRRAVAIPALGAALIALAGLGWGWREASRHHARTLALLQQVAPRVARFQDLVMQKPMDEDMRRVVAEQPLATLDQLVADEPGFGLAWSWRARVLRLLERDEEADADFDRGCTLAPEAAAPWVLRGVDGIERYGRLRGLPGVVIGATGLEFLPPRPDDAAQTALRTGALADLDRGERAPDVAGLPEADRRIARALAVLYGETPDRYDALLERIADLDDARAWGLRGRIHYYAKRFPESVAAWDQALERWPRDHEGWCAHGDARIALALTERWEGRDPVPGYRAALASYERALGIDPVYTRAQFSRGSTRTWLGEAEARRGEDARPTLAGALADLDAVVARHPDWAVALNNRGNVHLDLAAAEAGAGTDPAASLQRARADFLEAQRLAPGFPDPGLNLSAAAVARGNWEAQHGGRAAESYREALGHADAVLARHPGHSMALGNRALAWLSLGEAERAEGKDPRPAMRRALADFDAVIAAEPRLAIALSNRSNAWQQLARAELEQGEDPSESLARSVADSERALAVDPDNAEHYNNRALARQLQAQVLAARGQDARPMLGLALDDYEKALQARPGFAGALVNRGSCRMELAEAMMRAHDDRRPMLDAALADLTAALAIAPADANALTNRGLAHQEIGELEENEGHDAREWYRRAIADFDAALQVRPDTGSTLNDRAISWWGVARCEIQANADPGPAYARAEADYRAAIAQHQPIAWMNLGLVLRDLGRYAEAIEALERGARELPGQAEWAKKQIAQAQALVDFGGGWKLDMSKANEAFGRGDWASARAAYDRAFALFEAGLAAVKESERARQRDDPRARATLALAHFQRACAEAALLPAGEGRAAAMDRAFGHLDAAAGLGFREELEPVDEVEALAPLRADPRFARFVERVR